MTASATLSTPHTRARSLPAPGRTGAILAVSALPLWLVCFVLLYGSLGPKPATTPSLAEVRDQYLAGGAPILIFGVLAVFAALALAAAPAVIGVALRRLTGRRVVPAILVTAAATMGLLELWNTLSFFVFLASDPAHLPGWVAVVAEGTVGNTIVNAVAWSLASLAVPLLGFALWRAGVARRTGLVVAIVGAIALVAILVLQFGQPMSPSILLFALGIALLRRRK